MLEPELAHTLTLKALQAGLMPPQPSICDPALESIVCGIKFPNPLGMSAGFDKNAEVPGPLFKLGFGCVEVGTVTPRPQTGNDRPRVFRDIETKSIINRMGFPNGGMNAFKANLSRFLAVRPRPPGVLGINIGMNKNQTDPAKDYAVLIQNLAPLADYLTINISSPNTPGLRDLQQRDVLLELLGVVREERRRACGPHAPPIFVKLAPDLTFEQQEELASTLLEGRADGVLLTNTTLSRSSNLPQSFALQKGGLSGPLLRKTSTELIRNFYALTGGRLPIIGLGGISCAASAYEKIKAGASLVQLYTGLVYEGPSVIYSINKNLLTLLKADGYTNIAQAVGADTRTGHIRDVSAHHGG